MLFKGIFRYYRKYLFEFYYLNPYKALTIEGIIGLLLFPILFFFDSSYDDIKDFIIIKDWEFVLLVILSLIYLILSSFKSIYRVLTIRFYSPMTRALAESIIDPFDFICLFIYRNSQKNLDEKMVYYYVIIIISLFAISFLSLVCIDFIIFYCFGLEHNTHLEIQKRATFYENIDGNIMELESNFSVGDENYCEKEE